MKSPTSLLRALFLYHLAEYQSGNAASIQFDIQGHHFKIRDNGRGHAINRMLNDVPYLQLVYSQFEYPFEKDTDTPVQLHTIGISLINSLCTELCVTVHKKEGAYKWLYGHGKLEKEERLENPEGRTGNTLEGTINTDLFPDQIDVQEMEQWLVNIKAIHPSLELSLNGRELQGTDIHGS